MFNFYLKYVNNGLFITGYKESNFLKIKVNNIQNYTFQIRILFNNDIRHSNF